MFLDNIRVTELLMLHPSAKISGDELLHPRDSGNWEISGEPDIIFDLFLT